MYLDNSAFESAISAYLLDGSQGEALGAMLLVLAEKVHYTWRFNLDTEDAISLGVIACLSRLDRYQPERGRAFDFFTTVLRNVYYHEYQAKAKQAAKWRDYCESTL